MMPLSLLESARDELIAARRAASFLGWTDEELAHLDLLVRAVMRVMREHRAQISQLLPEESGPKSPAGPQMTLGFH